MSLKPASPLSCSPVTTLHKIRFAAHHAERLSNCSEHDACGLPMVPKRVAIATSLSVLPARRLSVTTAMQIVTVPLILSSLSVRSFSSESTSQAASKTFNQSTSQAAGQPDSTPPYPWLSNPIIFNRFHFIAADSLPFHCSRPHFSSTDSSPLQSTPVYAITTRPTPPDPTPLHSTAADSIPLQSIPSVCNRFHFH